MKVSTLRIPCRCLIESEKFYTEKLGLTKVFGTVSEGYIVFQIDNAQLLLELEEKGEFESARFLGFSIEVSNILQLYNTLTERGVLFTGPPEKQSWGGLMTHIIDCNENTFSFIQGSS
ncbi:VOC family protein [Agarivorans albus]|uniref:VOC family protein n=1 Tax=Agarivorans albus TaxID=182262 RepID=UPI000590A3F6|nr:VOC family protein [Agarivorans albus]